MSDNLVDILESSEYGAILKCRDLELADEFEDFLSETCFVLFQTKFDAGEVLFYFGQASSAVRVRELYERFIATVEQRGEGN